MLDKIDSSWKTLVRTRLCVNALIFRVLEVLKIERKRLMIPLISVGSSIVLCSYFRATYPSRHRRRKEKCRENSTDDTFTSPSVRHPKSF